MCYESSSGRTNKGWRDFLIVRLVVERRRMCIGQQSVAAKSMTARGPNDKRRRAQQWQRVDGSLLSE
jgi:hypothetical protein